MALLTKSEFKDLIESRGITKVVFARDYDHVCDAWRVFAYHDEGSFLHLLVSGRGPSKDRPRVYLSLDSAYKAIRGLGFTGTIMVEE